jgi:hypothetical protein
MARYDFLNEIDETPLFQYYKKYGEGAATGRTVSSLFAKYTLPSIIKSKTRNRITKNKLIEGHTLYWNNLRKLLHFLGRRGTPMSWGLYLDLCTEYGLTPTTGQDPTTHNTGPSKQILVYKLIEVLREKYSSRKEVGRTLLNKNIPCSLHTDSIEYGIKKIKHTKDVNGRLCRFKLTGKKTKIGNRDESSEVQVYELVEELIPYSDIQEYFPSLEEIKRILKIELAINTFLKGRIYQSKGYTFRSDRETTPPNPISFKKEKVGNSKVNSQIIENILVYKLIEIPREIYNSRAQASNELLLHNGRASKKGYNINITNNSIDYSKQSPNKIWIIDLSGRKLRFKETGNKIPCGTKGLKFANEIQAYELVEELIPYSDIQDEFPYLIDITARLNNTSINVRDVLYNKLYQSFWYRFYQK